MTEGTAEHEGNVLEHIVDHGGSVTLHTCDACVTPERLIHMYEQLIAEVRKAFPEAGA